MATTEQPVCISCGGSGVDTAFAEPDLSLWRTEHLNRWKRQLANRYLVLKGLDRYLGVDEAARLEETVCLTDFIHDVMNAMTEIASLGNSTRALSHSEAAPIVIDALEGLAMVAAEIVHYLAHRAYPTDPAVFSRMALEQKHLREHDENPDSDPDSSPDP